MDKNEQKHQMYKVTINKLTRSKNNGFYYEAIMIEYALIEDRVNVILEKLGIINLTSSGPKTTKRSRAPIKILLSLKDNQNITIRNIQTKLDLIKEINSSSDSINTHFDFLTEIFVKDKENINELVDQLISWKNERNKYVHALMNKVPDEIDEKLISLVEEGYMLFRRIDNLDGRLKKYNVRKKFKIQ